MYWLKASMNFLRIFCVIINFTLKLIDLGPDYSSLSQDQAMLVKDEVQTT
jgi:hypothetical protein